MNSFLNICLRPLRAKDLTKKYYSELVRHVYVKPYGGPHLVYKAKRRFSNRKVTSRAAFDYRDAYLIFQ